MGDGHLGRQVADSTDDLLLTPGVACERANGKKHGSARCLAVDEASGHSAFRPAAGQPSKWSNSAAKRIFDSACVLVSLPVLIPLVLAVAMAVRLTSRGPVLFVQKRVGRHGSTFAIFKFRSMVCSADGAHHPITTLCNQRFTPVGPFLRRWKLDELPQLANVLLGHMSLVGSRPKMPEHETFEVACRPGITGIASLAFAEEEAILARVPADELDRYYYDVVLPAKRQMDTEYMARATFTSDFRLLVDSVLRRWDHAAAEEFIAAAVIDAEYRKNLIGAQDPSRDDLQMPVATPVTG